MDRPANMRWARLAALFSLLAVVLTAAGCTSALATAVYLVRGTDVPAEFNGLREKRVAVVCRPLVGLTYRDSGVAKNLGQQISSLLRQKVKKIEVIDQSKVAEWIDEHSWDDYVQVGKALEADVIVGVDLEQFSLYEGQTVYQGRARVAIKVYDCKTKELLFEKQLPQIVYPPNHVISTVDVQEQDFRREYVTVLAENIARHFYPHDPHADFALDATALR